MSEIKHTPGPWIIDPDDTDYIVQASNPDSIGIAIVSTIDPMGEKRRWWFGPESMANAKLISAAPDLLADLQEAAATLRRYETLHRAKGTPDSTAKAEVNATLAARFEATIAKATE
ncbi:hypothetical protein [Pseudomonas sp. RIT-To-2]|uniref:hypothetical protein n=1 Tax=Pseudomonas sp. RIT-To-2 TaxID=3462541 RepID=UPI0024136135